MRRTIGWITTATMAALLGGCAATAPPPGGAGGYYGAPPPMTQPMSLGRAASVVAAVDGFTRNAVVTLNYVRPRGTRLTATGLEIAFDDGTWTCRFTDNALPLVEARFLANPPTTLALRCDRGMLYHWDNQMRNEERAAGWRALATAGLREAPDRQPAFLSSVAPYQAGLLGPEISESVRARKVAAEAAVRDRDLWRAIDEFEAGLELAPWWPQGNYNVALVYAELGLYPRAIGYMRRYLMLVPQAPNARQAQDKVYEWQARGG